MRHIVVDFLKVHYESRDEDGTDSGMNANIGIRGQPELAFQSVTYGLERSMKLNTNSCPPLDRLVVIWIVQQIKSVKWITASARRLITHREYG